MRPVLTICLLQDPAQWVDSQQPLTGAPPPSLVDFGLVMLDLRSSISVRRVLHTYHQVCGNNVQGCRAGLTLRNLKCIERLGYTLIFGLRYRASTIWAVL